MGNMLVYTRYCSCSFDGKMPWCNCGWQYVLSGVCVCRDSHPVVPSLASCRRHSWIISQHWRCVSYQFLLPHPDNNDQTDNTTFPLTRAHLTATRIRPIDATRLECNVVEPLGILKKRRERNAWGWSRPLSNVGLTCAQRVLGDEKHINVHRTRQKSSCNKVYDTFFEPFFCRRDYWGRCTRRSTGNAYFWAAGLIPWPCISPPVAHYIANSFAECR